MKELLRSNDLVLLSWIRSILNEENIEVFVMDEHMSILEGSANAIPHRLMVRGDELSRAIRTLKDAQSDIDGLSLFLSNT